jgi:hypothetical protein
VARFVHATRMQHTMADDGALSEFIDRRLRECERGWRAGVLPAIEDALAVCDQYSRPRPPWLVEAIRELIAQQILLRKGRGRFNSKQAISDENMKHYTRWDMVTDLRDRCQELYERTKHEADDLRRHRSKFESKGIDLSLLDDPDCVIEAWNLDRAFNIVSRKLEDTPYAGGWDAIRDSYYLVEERLAQGRGAEFYVPDFVPKRKLV